MQQVLQRVVDAVGWDGTIAGEAVDLHSEGSTLDFDTLEFIHSRKTGALFVAAAAVGGMLANIHPAPLQRIEVFAKNLGLAFQITDDVLDVTSNPESPRQGRRQGRAAPDVREARRRRRRAQAERGAGRDVAGRDRTARRGGEAAARSGACWCAIACGERNAGLNSAGDAVMRPAAVHRGMIRRACVNCPCHALSLWRILRAQVAQVAQLVEQRTENPRVGGSIPSLGTTFEPLQIVSAGSPGYCTMRQLRRALSPQKSRCRV